jgi:hypothetical protein
VQGEDTNTGVFFPAADTVAVATGGSERLRVDSSGNLGIGTSSPNSKLQVNTGTNLGGVLIGFSGGSSNFYDADLSVFRSGNGTERARIDTSGNLLVGTTSPNPNHTLEKNQASNVAVTVVNSNNSTPYGMNIQFTAAAPNDATRGFLTAFDTGATRAVIRSNGGLANFSANNVNLSDERVKAEIAPLGSYWDKIKALEVVTYKYRDQSHEDDNIGVIAQQVESVAPEFVSNDGFGETPADGVPLKSIYEADLHYATLKALQEAMARIEALEVEVAALEAAQ